MTRDEIVEVMARELTGFLGSNCCHRSGGQPGPNRRSDCDCVIAASAALAALEARGMEIVDNSMRMVRHKKRGTTYYVVNSATMQTAEPVKDGDALMVYRCREDGRLWARPFGEFHDGRFEDYPAARPEQE